MPPRTHEPSAAAFDASRLKARWRAEAAARRSRSAKLLAEARAKAAPVLCRFGAREAVVFGSLAEGTARHDSDIDLVVLGTEPTAYWDLRRELEAALGRPLDLFTEADDARFIAGALARGEVIYQSEH